MRTFIIDVEQERQIVVNSLLEAGKQPLVTVRYGNILDDTMIYVSNMDMLIKDAYVELSDSKGNKYSLYYKDTVYANSDIPGYTLDSLLIESGETYFLKILVPDHDTITAHTKVPYPPNVDTFYVISETDYGMYNINLILDDSCTKDYYYFESYAYIPLSSNFVRDLLPDSLYNCHKIEVNLELGYNDKLEISRVSEDFAKYYISMIKQIDDRDLNDFPNPFYEPVIVYSNIHNALGIFCAISKNVIIEIQNEKK